MLNRVTARVLVLLRYLSLLIILVFSLLCPLLPTISPLSRLCPFSPILHPVVDKMALRLHFVGGCFKTRCGTSFVFSRVIPGCACLVALFPPPLALLVKPYIRGTRQLSFPFRSQRETQRKASLRSAALLCPTPHFKGYCLPPSPASCRLCSYK